jgi:hypothetical protein
MVAASPIHLTIGAIQSSGDGVSLQGPLEHERSTVANTGSSRPIVPPTLD